MLLPINKSISDIAKSHKLEYLADQGGGSFQVLGQLLEHLSNLCEFKTLEKLRMEVGFGCLVCFDFEFIEIYSLPFPHPFLI